ncbi:coxsackievirus and adenovirus receptor homolog [Cebidichthys violaceus]|uniref:coxsackievirus and adenovirus receptor homolog n=1 Tax=Cebidichthys violaceus TaxID=271503 RepID=UPI0035CC9AD0
MLSSSVLCLLTVCLVSASRETARSEQDVTLRCRTRSDDVVTLLDWNRPDLKSDGYVFFYRHRRSYDDYQHPRYRGRVRLSDPEMKNGDVSLVLKNVSVDDTGTYECRVKISKETTHSEVKHLVNLTVTDSAVRLRSNSWKREWIPWTRSWSVSFVCWCAACCYCCFYDFWK